MTQSDVDELILRRLSAGEANPILVADFQSLSAAPRLSELLSECVRAQPVFQIDPVGVLSGPRRYVPLPDLAAACVDEFLCTGADHGQVFVVGHCSASALSLRVAGLLASTRSVTAVLVLPAWPGDALVATMFAEFLTKFGTATHSCPGLDADPDLVVSAMEQIFRDEIAALAASRGLTGATGAFSDLLVWYRGWLAFLLACRNDTSIDRAVGRAAVTVLSGSPSTGTVPGLGKDAYRVCQLPSGLGSAVTPELAELVAAHVTPH
ncbi:MAG: alpha/beta fold hydrolase [Jatrophihabitantaceae bacterium]